MQKEVFKSGTWVDSLGRKRTWTNADIDKIVSSYNPKNREAPLVFGHPKTNSPAYGWVKKVWRDGNGLWAEFKDIVAEAKTAIEKKMFKKTSISINPDGSLNHVGFLGGRQPAVPGLGDIQFQENSEAATIEFSDLPDDDNFDSIDKMDFFAFMADNTDAVVQSLIFSKEKSPTIEKVETWIGNNPQFVADDVTESKTNFRAGQKAATDFESLKSIKLANGINAIIGKIKKSTKGNNMDWEKKSNELEIELAAAKATITDNEKKLTDAEKLATDNEAKFTKEETAHNETKATIETAKTDALKKTENDFVEKLIKDRKLKPADKELTGIMLEKLRDAEEIEFTDSEGKKSKVPAQTQYMDKLDAVEPFVSNSEDFTDGAEAEKDAKLSKLSKARAAEKNIELNAATDEILAENPSLN